MLIYCCYKKTTVNKKIGQQQQNDGAVTFFFVITFFFCKKNIWASLFSLGYFVTTWTHCFIDFSFRMQAAIKY